MAVDGFYLDLLRRHEPAMLEGLRRVATTEWFPDPAPGRFARRARRAVGRLRRHLVAAHGRPEYRPLLADACVARFVAPALDSYRVLEEVARAAEAKGYPEIR